jgi:hypothetical protein
MRIALFAILLTAITACASAAPRGRVYVRVAPPAPIVETRVVSPGPGVVWVPGFYRWERGAYAWVPGRWERPPRAAAVWVPARWVHNRRGWFVVDGHWR